MKKLVILASGSGSNFQAIVDAVENKEISAEITGLIVNKPDAGAVRRARRHGIPVAVITDTASESFKNALQTQLDSWNPDLIVLAGFLKKIPAQIVKKYSGKIINIHPSLLPKYGGKGCYGIHVHRAVLDAGETVTGCTVHYVNEEYDRGDIIDRKTVPVLPSDTPESLASRVLKAEHKLLPSVIKKIVTPNL